MVTRKGDMKTKGKTDTPSYIELVRGFWQEYENKAMRPNDALLYLYLVEICNRNSWRQPFCISNKKLLLALEISVKTLIDSRARLAQRGLVRFQSGERNGAVPAYEITAVADGVLLPFCFKNSTKTVTERKQNRNKTETYYSTLTSTEDCRLKTEDNNDVDDARGAKAEVGVFIPTAAWFENWAQRSAASVGAWCMARRLKQDDFMRLAREAVADMMLFRPDGYPDETEALRHMQSLVNKKTVALATLNDNADGNKKHPAADTGLRGRPGHGAWRRNMPPAPDCGLVE